MIAAPPSLHRHATPQLHDYLESAALRAPNALALVAGDARLTYADIDGQANALANMLRNLGVERGDRVAIFAENSAETVIAFWSVLKASAVVTIINPQTKSDKLGYMLRDCRAKALVTTAALLPTVDDAIAVRTHLSQVIVVGASGATQMRQHLRPIGWQAAVDGRRDEPPPRCTIDIDLAAIIYTSGSTGEPKGVMLTHRNMLAAADAIATYLELRSDEVILGALPLAFDYGLYQMIMAFRMGARLVLERGFTYPAQVLATMAREKVTGFPGVPTMFAVLSEMADLSRYDLSSLRYVTNTAAALPLKHITKLTELFPQARIYSMYGLTECKRCTYLPPEDLARKPMSVGIAIPNTELWVVDEAGRRVGPNVVGQLVIRGPTVMKGYWEKPDATAEKLRPGPLPGEQVLYTGDLCRLDHDGYLYFVGRMDDIIKTRAEKVAPKEVENAIVDIDGVKEVAVVGVDDAVLGQAIKAFVVLEGASTLGIRDIVRECQKRLEAFMVPKYVELVDDLPKTTTGKIKKSGLR